MSVLAIVQPLPIAAIGGTLEGVQRLVTPSPREAAVSGAGNRTIDIDLGTATRFDTVFVGYSRNAADSFSASCGAADFTGTPLPALPIASSRLARRRHFLSVYDAPLTARYIRLGMAMNAGTELGVVAVGLAIRPSLGHEWGSGRFVTDTGSATRLAGGGFGLAPGARAGGWQWTLANLSDDEADAIYGLQLNVGSSSTILVAEDPAPTPGLNERIHWGVITKLEANERRAIADTKWDMRVEDWA